MKGYWRVPSSTVNRSEYQAQYYKENRERIRQRWRDRYSNDPVFRAIHQARQRAQWRKWSRVGERPEIARERVARARIVRRELVLEAKMSGCADCGEKDPDVLDFDHVGPKLSNISAMVNHCAPIERIRAELKRCQVRCANCHRRVTAQRRRT